MKTKWQLWNLGLILAGALAGVLAGTPPALAAEPDAAERDTLSWTLLAGRQGEPGRLGVDLRGNEPAALDVWLDFDQDGFFSEGEERVLDGVRVAPGLSIQTFELPAKASLNAASRIRVRVSDTRGEPLMDQEKLAFPERVIAPGCGWTPGFGGAGSTIGEVYTLEVFDGALYAGGSFTALGGVPVSRVARWDGREWQAVGSELASGIVNALEAFDDGDGPRLYAGSTVAPYLYRWDGVAWQGLQTGISGGAVNALAAWDDGDGPALFVGGAFTSAGGLGSAGRIARWDGSGWQALGGGLAAEVNALTVLGVGLSSRLEAGGGTSAGNSFVSSWNGSAWTARGNPGQSVRALRELGGQLYAGGDFGVKVFSGAAWTTVGGLTTTVRALETYNDGQGSALYAGGDSVHLVRWTGTAWAPLANFMNNRIQALTTYQEPGAAPALFVGGWFVRTNATPADTTANLEVAKVARYDAQGFSSLASGTNHFVWALEADPDPASSDLYASGRFSQAGGLEIRRIARWDGRWHAVGDGLPSGYGLDIVFDQEVSPRKLYVAARGDDQFGALLELQGSTWVDRASFMNNDARTAAKFGGLLYVGGAFTRLDAAATNPNRLATWNGTAWGLVGTNEINGAVNALQVFDFGQGPRLVLAGAFTRTAVGNSISRIAVWDGSQWSSLGGNSPFSGEIRALAVHDDGNGPKLYAAGDHVAARWDVDHWTTLGSGVGGTIHVLHSFSDGTRPLLAAGGDFTSIGGVPAGRFALWDGQGWNAIGSGFDGAVKALAAVETAEGNLLYAAGEFTNANGLATGYVARLGCPSGEAFDASIVKTSPTSTVTAGQQVQYQIEVHNHGPGAANGIRAEDTFAAILQSCAWTAQASGGATGQHSGAGPVLRQTLNLPAGARVSYDIACTVAAAAEGILDNDAFLVTSDQDPRNDTDHVSHVILPPPTDPGDCNQDDSVDQDDYDAFHLEIFDGDGTYPGFTPKPPFIGNPEGCDANVDASVDAGDLACLARLIGHVACLASALPPGGSIPQLVMSDQFWVVNHQVQAAVSLTPANHPLNAVAFELEYDPAKLELPGDPQGHLAAFAFGPLPAGSKIYTHVDPDRQRIAVAVNLPLGQSFSPGRLLTITFGVPSSYYDDSVIRGVVFAGQTAPSFGNTSGQSVFGLGVLQRQVIETLVILNSSRLFATPGLGFGVDQQARLTASLETFLEHHRVQGLPVDIGADADLRQLYKTWDQTQAPAAANNVLFGGGGRRGLQKLLLQLVQVYPQVKHLLIVGDDRIVPFARLPDQGQLSEVDYLGTGPIAGLPAHHSSTVGRALAANYYLSDDPLATRAALSPSSLGSSHLSLPDFGIGRLVENAAEILGAFTTFFETDGIVDLDGFDPGEAQVRITGYDFSIDGALAIEEGWRRAFRLLPSHNHVAPVDGILIHNSWNDDNLLVALRQGARLFSLNGHASHYQVGSPNGEPFSLDGLPALELAGADGCGNLAENGGGVDLSGALVLGQSCHGGLPVPGACSTAADHSLDLPQTFLATGALAYGDNTGFGWGLLYGVGLGEGLALRIEERILSAEPFHQLTLGEAVRRGKLDYYLQQFQIDPFDRKTLMQWTLYGFPMVEIGMPRDLQPSLAGREPEFGPPGADGYQRAEVAGTVIRRRQVTEGSPEIEIPPHLLRQLTELQFDLASYRRVELTNPQLPDDAPCPVAGCYWQYNGLATDEVGLPIEPLLTLSSSVERHTQKDLLWTGGSYLPEVPFYPVLAVPTSNVTPGSDNHGPLPVFVYQRPAGPNGGGWLGGSHCADDRGPTSQIVLPLGELKRLDGSAGWEGRLYTASTFEVLYRSEDENPADDDCDPPAFGPGPYDTIGDDVIRWSVPITDTESGVWRALVVWDNRLAREWQYVELEYDDTTQRWTGSAPTGNQSQVVYFLQTVDREGNVAWKELLYSLPFGPRSLPQAFEGRSDRIFEDGFESGDCSAWEVCP